LICNTNRDPCRASDSTAKKFPKSPKTSTQITTSPKFIKNSLPHTSSSLVRTSYGDATKSSPSSPLPGVSFLFAYQSRSNVSPGNDYEFYSDLIFLLPIVVRETRRAFFAINHLRRYSATSGCIPNFCVIPRAKKRSTSLRRLLSCANFAFSFSFFSSSPVANKNSANAPGVREIREGCAPRRRGSFREKM